MDLTEAEEPEWELDLEEDKRSFYGKHLEKEMSTQKEYDRIMREQSPRSPDDVGSAEEKKMMDT